MTDSKYIVEKFNSNTFIEIPRYLNSQAIPYYYKPYTDEIYPKIYDKTKKQWKEYCLFDANKKPYYAKKENGEPYYPTDYEGRMYVICNNSNNPEFIIHQDVSFIHLDAYIWPLEGIEISQFKLLETSYRMLMTTKNLSTVGALYLHVMTEKPSPIYENWRALGMTDKDFEETEENGMLNERVYNDGHLFVFIDTEKHYLDLDKNCFVNLNSGLTYDLDFNKNKLYFNDPDKKQYFIIKNKTDKHFILASNDKGLRAYEIFKKNWLKIYYPDLPPGQNEIQTILLNPNFSQELDDHSYIVCYNSNDDDDDERVYFWYEYEQIVYFDYDENNHKQRYIEQPGSKKKRYFEFIPVTDLFMKRKYYDEVQPPISKFNFFITFVAITVLIIIMTVIMFIVKFIR